jgi:uncharacterized protein (DUF1501 family)
VPLALRGKTFVAPSLRRLADYELLVDARGGRAEVRREEVAELVRSAADRSGKRQDLATFIGEVGRSALDSEARLRRALGSYAPRAEFPQGQFGDALGLLSRVIVSGFGTRLFHLSLGGFDTHASQAPTHAGLLRLLSRGLGALVRDLEAHRALDGVTILVYSEFGRRVAENRSQGTDHGAAAPVLVPDFDDLIDGDVRPTTDFRRVYASLCRRLGVPAEAVVGNGHEPLELWT